MHKFEQFQADELFVGDQYVAKNIEIGRNTIRLTAMVGKLSVKVAFSEWSLKNLKKYNFCNFL